MRLTLTLALLLSTSCKSPRDRCERVARRLMPEPQASFIELCVSRFENDPETARTIDCLLAVGPEGVYEKDLERCGASEHLPLLMQF